MALYSYCAGAPSRIYSLTHSLMGKISRRDRILHISTETNGTTMRYELRPPVPYSSVLSDFDCQPRRTVGPRLELKANVERRLTSTVHARSCRVMPHRLTSTIRQRQLHQFSGEMINRMTSLTRRDEYRPRRLRRTK